LFLGNPHVQTVLGNLLPGAAPRMPVRQRQVSLADGDRMVLHDSQPRSWQPGEPIVLLVHGLGGSHQSGTMVRLTGRLFPRGLRVVRLDLRGAGAGEALARRTYNGGCSGDVRAALELIHHEDPASPLLLAGFSLGGNIVLKLAGEAANRPVPGLQAVAAVAPPIDMERCSELLARQPFYDSYFVRALLGQVRRQQRYFPDEPRVRFPTKMTLRLFDELYTAPRGGYRDALDYYRRAASLPLLDAIQLPTFLLTAADDPFVAVQPFRELPSVGRREVHIVEHGGHLGFLGWDGAGGIRWAERRLADWLLAIARGAV